MTREELITELKQNDNLLPQDILKDTTMERLTADLIAIFETEQSKLRDNDRFKANFTEIINYVYLVNLNKKPEQRNKEIFQDSLISFLLNPSPYPAV